jgi:LasA protease
MRSRKQVLSRAAFTVCVLASLAGSAFAQPGPEFPGTQRPAVTNPAGVYPDGYSKRWLEDADFLYGPRLLDFNLNAFLEQAAPHLVPYSTAISHWSGLYSISPKVLLTVMEMRSSAVSNPAGLADPFAGLAGNGDFETQIRYALASLFEDYYAYRRAVPQRDAGDGMNASTYALLTFFRGASSVAAFAGSASDTAGTFAATLGRLFPSGLAVDAPADPIVAVVPPSTLLQLPWKNAVSWYFGGVHTTTGANNGTPMSSLDFYKGGQGWGADTSTDYVVAAHAGTVTVYSSCNVTVTSNSGWQTNYYHLSTLAVSNGQQIAANQTIGVYANSQAQALCQGGSSTGPHVHFSLLNNGEYTSLDGVSLSGFVVHPGQYSYDTRPAYMWLTKNGVTYYVGSAIQSSATGTLPNMTVNDASVSEGNSGTKSLTFTVSLSAAAGSTTTVNYATEDITTWSAARWNAQSIAIPSSGTATPYPSTITVPAGVGTVTKVTAVLKGFTHTYPSDVNVLLVGPGGEFSVLMSAVGGSNPASNLTFTFDESAGSAIPAGPLISGTYRTQATHNASFPAPAPIIPIPTNQSLNVFNGTNPSGTWTLYVYDAATSDLGSYSGGWQLNIATTVRADYVPASGVLTFPAGSSSQPLAITINGDTDIEPSETFRVNLTSASNATLIDSVGVATISNDDVAAAFTDATLMAGTTFIKAIHVTELRTRINAARSVRGLAAYAWTDPSPMGIAIKAIHITEMRTALAQAYAAAGLVAPTYTDPTLTNGVVRAVHLSELRSAVITLESS